MTPATIETVEQLDRERARDIARSMFASPSIRVGNISRQEWLDTWGDADHYADECWPDWLFVARNLRQADERAGLVTVPVEETAEMIQAAIRAEDHGGDGDTWAAKLLASPFASAAQGEGGE